MVRKLSFDPIEEAHRQWHRRWPAGEAMAAATSIMRAQQIVLARVDEALRPHGLTFARYEALVLLSFSRRGALPLGKMGERLMIHPTSVTNIVDRLEIQGHVRRVRHPEDRRATLAEITESGRAVLEAGTHSVCAVALGLGGLGERDIDQITHVLRKLRVAAGDFDTAGAESPASQGGAHRTPSVSPRESRVRHP